MNLNLTYETSVAHMNTPRFLYGIALASAVLIGGCGSDLATHPSASVSSVPSDFDISVSSGTTPSFSWPGGAAILVYIEEAQVAGAATALEMWSVGACGGVSGPTCTSTRGFTSPVRFGTMPSGGVCGDPFNFVDYPLPPYVQVGTRCPSARSLQAGRSYLVVIDRLDGRIGARYFTP